MGCYPTAPRPNDGYFDGQWNFMLFSRGLLIGGNWNCPDDGCGSFRFHGGGFVLAQLDFGSGLLQTRQRIQNGLLHRRIGKISQVTTLRKDR